MDKTHFKETQFYHLLLLFSNENSTKTYTQAIYSHNLPHRKTVSQNANEKKEGTEKKSRRKQ